ncbi:MAG: hypothetical protein AAF667_15365 [Pseudomonadota bacterium]
MAGNRTPEDPKGLIFEAYRIEGITIQECRSIFMDWALSTNTGPDPAPLVRALLDRHGPKAPDHPMTAVLSDGLKTAPACGRRGGRAARLRSDSGAEG